MSGLGSEAEAEAEEEAPSWAFRSASLSAEATSNSVKTTGRNRKMLTAPRATLTQLKIHMGKYAWYGKLMMKWNIFKIFSYSHPATVYMSRAMYRSRDGSYAFSEHCMGVSIVYRKDTEQKFNIAFHNLI